MNRLDSLAEVSLFWLDRAHPLRQKAVRELQTETGYSKALVERALADSFGELNAEKLKEYVSARKLAYPADAKTVLLIAARNVFTAWLHSATISLLLGWDLWLKPSSREMAFPRLWRESLALKAPDLAKNLRIVSWHPHLPQQVDAVIAYGSDATLTILREKFKHLPFAKFGHKLSMAVVFKEAEASASILKAAVEDITAYNLEGCLSPQVFYVEDSTGAMESRVANELPHNPLPKWIPFNSISSVWKAIGPFNKHLSTVGVAGSAHHIDAVRRYFENRPDVRVCLLGDMQRPPLEWRNSGIDIAKFLSTAHVQHRVGTTSSRA